MGRFVRSVDVPVRPAAAYKRLVNNWGFMLRDLPEVAGTAMRVRGTNRSVLVTVRSTTGDEGRFEIFLRIGWRWRTPLSFTTEGSEPDELPASFHPVRGTVTVRPGGDGAELEVVVEIDGVTDDDPGVGAVLDRGADVLARRLLTRRVAWY